MDADIQKYRCSNCGEIFAITEPPFAQVSACPRCLSSDFSKYNACNLEVMPPPWEYRCNKCGTKFQVESPRGPDEAKAFRCPVCRSREVRWLALASFTCATGG